LRPQRQPSLDLARTMLAQHRDAGCVEGDGPPPAVRLGLTERDLGPSSVETTLSACRTCNTPVSRSTSCQRRPSNSPRRMSVCNATSQTGPYRRSPAAAWRNRWTSATSQLSTTRRLSLGGATASVKKSSLAQHLVHHAVAADDMQVVVIDPDADVVNDIVGWLPDAQKLRAVVVDVGHPTLAPGLNLLDARTGRDDDQVVGAIVEAWQHTRACAQDMLRGGTAWQPMPVGPEPASPLQPHRPDCRAWRASLRGDRLKAACRHPASSGRRCRAMRHLPSPRLPQ